jgi:muconolactone delta-isomerase
MKAISETIPRDNIQPAYLIHLLFKGLKDLSIVNTYRMELIERMPLKECTYLNQLTFREFKNFGSSCKNDDERRKNFDKLKAFCAFHLKARGEIKRLYKFTLQTNWGNEGRLFCGNSVQGLPKIFRGFLLRNTTTTDIDMVNAHPRLLLYLCKLHQLHCPELTYYVENRDAILNAYGGDREAGKVLYLKAVNNDKLDKTETNKAFKEFDKEMKELQKQVTALPEYSEIVKTTPETKLYNWYGSAINRILCAFENKVLQVAVRVVNRRQIEICSLMFDGLLVYGDYYETPELLREIEDAVEVEFLEMGMEFDYKAHSQTTQMPEDWTEATEERNEGKRIVTTELDAVELIFEEVKKNFIYSQEVIYHKQDNHMWSSNQREINAHLTLITLKSNIFKEGGKKDEIVPFVQNKKVATNVASMVLDMVIKNNKNDAWISTAPKSSLRKVLFLNGYYDFLKGEFITFGNPAFDNSIVFFERINYSYEPTLDEKIDDVKKRLFYDPLGKEVGDYMILNIARGLAGDCMKRILFCLGSGNTGKSILTLAIQHACGGYYGDFNAMNVAVKKNGSQDEAQNLRWVMLLKHKRIICSNEIKNCDLDGNAIKKLSSGGVDNITARLHGGNETSVNISFLPIIFANDIKNVTPKDDALDFRLKCATYVKGYVENPTNEFELKKDEHINEEVVSEAFKLTFINMLFTSYKDYLARNKDELEPQDAVKAKESWFKIKKNQILEELLNDFEITNCEDDYIQSSYIEEWIKGKNLDVSMTKLGLEVSKHAKLKGFANVYSKPKKIGSKTKQVWYGLKILVEDEIDDE